MMTIGGNDLDFDGIVKSCFTAVIRSASDCKTKINDARNNMEDLELILEVFYHRLILVYVQTRK